jgi:phosphoglycolate phosphatase
MNNLPFDIVGFDLDGTLLDTSRDLGAAVNHALGLIGRTAVPESAVSGLIGGGSRLMLRRALALTGGEDGVDIDSLYPRLLAYYEAHIAVHTALYPGGAAMLDALEAAGVRLALVTNKPEELALKLLDALDLRARFGCVIGGGGAYPLKPAPDVLHAMVAALGGGRAAYVGDTTFDTRAAQAAGLPCIAVSFGFNDVAVDQLDAAAVIDHFDQLVPALSTL